MLPWYPWRFKIVRRARGDEGFLPLEVFFGPWRFFISSWSRYRFYVLESSGAEVFRYPSLLAVAKREAKYIVSKIREHGVSEDLWH